MINFEYLPCREVPILESEEHVLTECPAYHSIRVALPDSLKVKSLLMLKDFGIIMSSIHMKEFGRYLLACYKLRNPYSSSNLYTITTEALPPYPHEDAQTGALESYSASFKQWT